MNRFKLHNVQFFHFQPKAIQCLAYDEDSELLAVGRSDSSIEIWDLKYAPYQEAIISCSEDTVESLAWYNGRLFSVGLNAEIAEYDLIKLTSKYSFPVHSSPCHCMAVNTKKAAIAVGTENGYICIFKITSNDLNFEKTLSKQEGRIICIAWHPTEDIIVSGSIDVIRIWNVKSGYASERIIVGSLQRKKETIVWCIAVTSDFTIISGDSWGRTSFWDGKTTTLIDSMKIHKADILTLCLSKDENFVYVSGVDPIIIQFVRVQSTNKQKWVKSVQRRLHTHDVTAVTLAKEYLISGGIDVCLTLSKYPPKTQIKCSPFPKKCQVSVANKAHCLLLNYSNSLEMWQLGHTNSNSGNNGEILPLVSREKKILQLNCKNNETIICCCLSDDGRWLAYSTKEKLKLYHFSLEEDTFTALSHSNFHKVHLLPKECSSVQLMTFTPMGKFLVMITPLQNLQVIKVDLIQPTLIHNISKPNENKYRYTHLSVSRDGSYIACADNGGNVIVYNFSTGKVGKIEIHSVLPHHKCQATALSFHHHSNNLVVVYSDQKFIEYSLEAMEYTRLSKRYHLLEMQGVDSHSSITGVLFVPNNENLILLYDDSQIYVINKTESMKETSKRHCNKEKETKEASLTIIKRHKHMLLLNSLIGEELVAVTITPLQIMNNLPPPLWQKKYGT
ncbi:U3 small nucleolar RNA-associated protein 4 homolog isoform X1 [Centruroides sculpturatus]|uniref:U3 small nucleolar RNA-associated protein 4 homolog isoform X1 n=1 Tax=Centruroides sculpturatus TaxID=218467 RepID=UPI000C6E8E3E|nr:U3 small nucleolar RNA-associated protein 4 homolog isoform X1 [Centruroides sculpturatus]